MLIDRYEDGRDTYYQAFHQTPEIGTLVQKFDFGKVEIKDGDTSNKYLHVDLAPDFHDLTATTLADVKITAKAMMTSVIKALARCTDQNYDVVENSLTDFPLFTGDPERIQHQEKIVKNSLNDFKNDGIVDEVRSMIARLVSDGEVLKSANMDDVFVGKLVKQVAAVLHSFDDFASKKGRHEQCFVDIGVLRFPNPNQLFFLHYHLKLMVGADYTRTAPHHKKVYQITGEYNAHRFHPNDQAVLERGEDAQTTSSQFCEGMVRSWTQIAT